MYAKAPNRLKKLCLGTGGSWVCLSEAARQVDIPRHILAYAVESGRLPRFRKQGWLYRVPTAALEEIAEHLEPERKLGVF